VIDGPNSNTLILSSFWQIVQIQALRELRSELSPASALECWVGGQEVLVFPLLDEQSSVGVACSGVLSSIENMDPRDRTPIPIFGAVFVIFQSPRLLPAKVVCRLSICVTLPPCGLRRILQGC
jgi:hypothetical protein